MKCPTIIKNDLTLQTYGYDESTLHKGSHNKVIVECINCKKLIHREYRYVTKYHQCQSVKDGKKRCFKCQIWKNFEEFPKCPRASGGVGKMCKQCYNSHPSVLKYECDRSKKRKYSFDTDIESYLKIRCYAAKKQSIYKQVPFDLTPEFLIKLWKSQNGKCYYSNLPMVSHGRDFGWQRWNSPSLDRKDPDIGYTKNNVVWCCFGINSFKGRMNESQFKEMIQTIDWWYNNE